MGTQHDIIKAGQRSGVGFVFKYVQTGAPEVASFERLDQRLFIDDSAPGSVYQHGTGLESRQCAGIDQVPGLLGERQMNTQHVAGF